MAIFAAVERYARKAGATVAAVDTGRTDNSPFPPELSYADLYDAAMRLSCLLAARATSTGPIATHMRRGNEWYVVFVAASRLGVPVVALSQDLPDKKAEESRNTQILVEHQPALLIVDTEASIPADCECAGSPPVVTFAHLWEEAQAAVRESVHVCERSPGDLLCFCYTGGSTEASRCVRVTHGMAAHELATYPTIITLTPEDRVLQQHSLYWAASAYGELDIALAFGCAIVFCTAWGAEGVLAAISTTGATCAGLVPSVLAALEPADKELSSLRVVFTWGEALQPRVARKWASHVHLIDLLISTECWLSLYSDWTAFSREGGGEAVEAAGGGERPVFRLVAGTVVKLQELQGESGDQGAASSRAGELLVSGPMVCDGYTDPARTATVFSEKGGVRWYCTRDCLEVRSGGYAFAGRADDLIKVGGEWVDVRDIERSLEAVEGVAHARIYRRDAYVVLQPGHSGALACLRRALPADFRLYVVPRMPTRVGTEKVDCKHLAGLVETNLEQRHRDMSLEIYDREAAELRGWYWPLALLLVRPFLIFCFDAFGEPGIAAFAFALAASLLDMLMRGLCLSYLLLLPMYDSHIQGRVRNFPFGHIGAFVALSASLPGKYSLIIAASPGFVKAARRGRLLSWPVISFVAFPIWARQTGDWWLERGFRGVLRYYWHKVSAWCIAWSKRVVSSAKAAFRLLQAGLSRAFGGARSCAECARMYPASAGHVDSNVDEKWYCKECWSNYYMHRCCTVCQEWRTRGAESNGAWACERCDRKARNQYRPEPLPANSLLEPLLAEEQRDPGSTVLGQGEPEEPSPALARAGDEAGGPPGTGEQHGATAPRDGSDNKWGQRRQVEHRVISLTLPHVPSEACAQETAAGGAMEAKSHDWLLIERATGWTFPSTADSIAGLDSLRITKLSSALRRQAGVRIGRATIQACKTLGELLSAISQTPVEHDCCHGAGDQVGEYAAWGMMWNSKCHWTLIRNRPLSEDVLRRAVAGLIERHECLRVSFADPLEMFQTVQMALSILELWRLTAFRGRVGLALDRLVSWALRVGWPRLRTGEPFTGPLPIAVLPRKADVKEAKSALYWEGPNFSPPLQVVLVQHGTGEAEGAVVQLIVSHMVSDGYCIVPLLADLAELVAQLEASPADGPPGPPLPRVPSALASLEQRIMRTIVRDASLRDMVTLDAIGKRCWQARRLPATVLATVPAELVARIRDAAQGLAVSSEILMLTALGTTLARFYREEAVAIALVVPQRDLPGESDMVGLFADVRILLVRTSGLSFAGTATYLQNAVKERLWHQPPFMTLGNFPFVNFEWTDFDVRHGFQQEPFVRRGPEALQNPLKIAVDQVDRETWRMRTAFDINVYGDKDRERFFELFEECLFALLVDPLVMV